ALILADDAHVLAINSAALTRRLACLGIAFGRVAGFAGAASEPFEPAYRRALGGTGCTVLVTATEDRRQGVWRVRMAPLLLLGAQEDADGSNAVLAIVDPPLEPRVSVSGLERLYRLTAAEARVLALLLDANAPQQIAGALGISITTVRTHLQALF